MATNNRRVAAYLPPELDERFKAFKIECGLADKAQPNANDSKALVQVLSEYFGVSQNVTHSVAYSEKYATTEELQTLQSKVDELFQLLQKSEARIDEAVSEAKSELKSELKGESELEASPGQLVLLDSEAKTEGKEAGSNESSSNVLGSLLSRIPSELLGGLSGVKLGERLKCDRKKIARQRNTPNFAEFCREKDPYGLAWEFREDKKYYPVEP